MPERPNIIYKSNQKSMIFSIFPDPSGDTYGLQIQSMEGKK